MLNTKLISRLVRPLMAAVVALALASGVGLLAPQTAHGQFGMMGGMGAGMGDMTDMAVTRQSMQRYCELMEMGEVERELALELHVAYLENYKKMSERFMGQIERMQREVQETRDFSVFQEKMPALVRDLVTRMEELEKSIFEDLRMLGNVDESDERWLRVERMRRREQVRHSSMISGDSVDLIAVVRGLEVEDVPAPVTEALGRYELELDSVLSERQRLNDEATKKSADAMEDMFDPEQQAKSMQFWEDYMTKTQTLGRRAKGINARYAAEIERFLAPELQGKFDREVKRLTWPAVYRESYPDRLLNSAEGMSDLTDQQRQQLTAIRREYEGSAGAINSRWARLIDDRESNAEGMFGGFMFGMDDESDEAKARTERRDLDKRTADQIKGVLTAAQQDRLPDEYDLSEEDDG